MSQIETIKALHSEGKYQQAIEGYQNILVNDPNNDEAHFGLAHASSRTQQFETALQHAKQAVELFPNSYRYQQFKAQMMLANNDLDGALMAFKQSLQENPNLFQSYLAIGDIYATKNDFKKAKENFNLALKVNQDGVAATVKLARLLIIEGDFDTAESMLQKAQLHHPDNPAVQLQMGILHLEQDQQGFAELNFTQLIAQEPQNHVANAHLSISLLNADNNQANQIINKLIDQQIAIPEMIAAMGLSYVNSGNNQEAIKRLAAVCQSGLAYPSWLMGLAQAYINNSQPNSAISVLEEVLRRGKHNKALVMLGNIHQHHENYSSAIKTYQLVDETDPIYQSTQLLQAECHLAEANYAAVIDILKPLLAEAPDHSKALKLQINALVEIGQTDQALKVIETIDTDKQMDAFNQEMYLNAGLLMDSEKQYDSAWKQFLKLNHEGPSEFELLNEHDEKMVQQFKDKSDDTPCIFVFSDPATGHNDLVNWLAENNYTPLLDRGSEQARKDLFAMNWSAFTLSKLSETEIHFLRKKYFKNRAIKADSGLNIVDFLPSSPINVAVIKKIFPQAKVLLLSRNFADLRLHDRVFGNSKLPYSSFLKITNQMVALNSNLTLVDVDAWMSGDAIALHNMAKVFGNSTEPFSANKTAVLNRHMLPFMHWKNYQQQLND